MTGRGLVLSTFVLALWLAAAGNLPLWQKLLQLDQSSGQRWWLVGVLGSMVFGGILALLSLLHWRWLFRPLASVLVLVTAFNSYFMWQYHAVIDSTMLANVIHTDVNEVRDLLSWRLVATVLLIAGPGLWWIWRRPLDQRSVWSRLGVNVLGVVTGLVVVVAMALAGYQGLSSLMRNDKSVRYMINPLNSVYASAWLATHRANAVGQAIEPVGLDARLGASYSQQPRPPLLVMVVGETARAQNWGLDGYTRQTTPSLAQWQSQGDLINYPHVSSCGTNTQVSVPCMFSSLTRENGGGRDSALLENVLDVLQRAGLAVLWIDNQSGCKGVCARVPTVAPGDTPDPAWCDGGECFDEAMLQGLDQRIAALDPQRRERGVVVVMHQMGSHGPAYFKRTPADRKPFVPECRSNTLTDCSPEQLVNAYDNTIAYTDHFLGQALSWLQAQAASSKYDTGLIYVSDHGESLGENGLYLHGMPYAFAPEQQTHVPMVTWLSPGLQQRSGVRSECLRARASEPYSHDNLFHTLLGVMDVSTEAYVAALDAFAPCASAGSAPAPSVVKPSPAG